MDPGDGKVTREFDLGNILNDGVEAFGGPITIDLDEKVRRFDGIIPGTRPSEIVCGGD